MEALREGEGREGNLLREKSGSTLTNQGNIECVYQKAHGMQMSSSSPILCRTLAIELLTFFRAAAHIHSWKCLSYFLYLTFLLFLPLFSLLLTVWDKFVYNQGGLTHSKEWPPILVFPTEFWGFWNILSCPALMWVLWTTTQVLVLVYQPLCPIIWPSRKQLKSHNALSIPVPITHCSNSSITKSLSLPDGRSSYLAPRFLSFLLTS